jgi:hypothetical protein
MKVFAALYSDGPGSVAGILSLHFSKECAVMAVLAHKETLKQEFLRLKEEYPDIWDDEWSEESGSGFDFWTIEEIEVQP